ncbi:CCA tRNA nucleotidyltransferase [Campylobacter troglodytis]|uniref:CCA tRNA nucleotidyltransferase n=1 Tax=Campylobacter troglodytis TaxID=654363 RepID=UPI00115B64E1|nr:CCA tRNA nucleotidyltransferase [Campylobacter troglodytis]TQR60955.1 CCA tRNA nucleotidyltransferase [Campylobacter troglodytis]
MQVSKISLKNNPSIEFIAKFLAPHTKRAYLVGGCVRDLLLGLEITDFDIEVYDINPHKFDSLMQEFNANGFGKSFFVYKFKNYDLSLARSENKIAKGHKGFEVSICNDEKLAAKRRDFSINSMMINIFNDEFLDLYGGLEDLKARTLRHVDDLSFIEDPLRVLRALHFVARFDLKIAQNSLNLMKTMDINELSKDRINAELYKFFKARNLRLGFEFLQTLNLEKTIFFTDTKAHEKIQSFKTVLENSRKFIKNEGLFLYLYLNFFELDKDAFFKKTRLKKSLLSSAKQPFFEDKINDLDLAKIALKMPLSQWLGLWDEKRINRAKKLGIYKKALRAKIDTSLVEGQGLQGRALGEKIEELRIQWLKAYLRKQN